MVGLCQAVFVNKPQLTDDSRLIRKIRSIDVPHNL